jgi:hypothetical protein
MKKISIMLFTAAFVFTLIGAFSKLESWAFSSYLLYVGIGLWCAGAIAVGLWLARGVKES